MAAFTLLTLNTWKCDGDYLSRLPLMARGVEELSPDVVFLQESFSAPERGYDTAVYIAERAGYRVAQAKARQKIRSCNGKNVDSSSNLAILTQAPCLSKHIVDLPSDPADGERIALLAEVQSPIGPTILANLHLTHLGGRDDLRRAQMTTMAESLPVGATALVAGDFNCPSAVIAEPGMRLAAHQVVDATNQRRLRTTTLNPLDDPAQRQDGNAIDHVLILTPDNRPSSLRLTEATVVMNFPNPTTGLYPSDHAGVFVRVSD